MYGMIMPILFPIALFGIINMYVVEKLCLAYYYKQPPNYDEKLQASVQSKLCYAPILMFAMGYWGMSNRQMFYYNDLSKRQYTNIEPNPNHYYSFFEYYD
jgi:hypothetical protein